MTARILTRLLHDSRRPVAPESGAVLAFLLGILMPMIAAWTYPTYVHLMPDPVIEWTRLQEVPFVICEAVVVIWAMMRGMELRDYARLLPRDCLLAGGLLLAGLWGSTLFVSKVPGTSLMISLSTVLHLLFGLSIFHLLGRASPRTPDRFAAGLGCGLIALACLTAWRFMLPPPSWQVPGGVIEWSAALPGFISVRHFGSWAGAVAAIFAAMILYRRRSGALSSLDLFYWLSMMLTIWSGTRAAVLAIGCACAIMAISRREAPDLQALGRLAGLTAAAFCAAYLLLPYDDPAFFLFRASDPLSSADEVSSGRISLWIATYSKWLQAVWFGWGSGSTFWEVNVGWTHTQPHNFVLQFLISWGIVGACGGLWLIARATREAHRRARSWPAIWPLNVGLYSLLIMATLEGMLHYPRFVMLIMALYALIFRIAPRGLASRADPDDPA